MKEISAESTLSLQANAPESVTKGQFNAATINAFSVTGPDDAHSAHIAENGNGVAPGRPAKSKKAWTVKANPALLKIVNPIRKLVESLVLTNVGDREFISLAQGDPAVFGLHMKVPEVAITSVVQALQEGNNNGYTKAFGLSECRRAIAEHVSRDAPYAITEEDVAMTVGAGHALHLTIHALTFPGSNILLPRPGFPLYEALCKHYESEFRYYDLLDDRDSEVDLDQVAALADEKTSAILLCNPGNPSGAVFSYEHMSQIAKLAAELKIPIISDEVYSTLVFGKKPFVSMSKFSSEVPVLAIDGISKGWLATGWRLGWVAIWDCQDILKDAQVIEGIRSLLQLISGPATPIQAAIPRMLKETPASFYKQTCELLRSGAELCYTRANEIPGLHARCRPEGSMFMMVGLDLSSFKDIKTDLEFSMKLLKEEAVLILPGTQFGRPSSFRLVFALSVAELSRAWDRIEEFCRRHTI